MQAGSKGPHVTLLHAFLCGAGFGNGIVTDGEYGEVMAGCVMALQDKLSLESDGFFGPATRAKVKEVYGFDFEAACQTIPGETEFVQSGGGG